MLVAHQTKATGVNIPIEHVSSYFIVTVIAVEWFYENAVCGRMCSH